MFNFVPFFGTFTPICVILTLIHITNLVLFRNSMKSGEERFYSLDQPWSQFSKAWKRTRHKASERSVHDLRVNARRLIETLGLAQALTKQNDVTKLKRRIKKFLKTLSALHDIQVQLETIAHLPRSQTIIDFTQRLRCLERQEVDKIQNKLKRTRKRRLTDAFNELRSEFIRSQERAATERTQRSIRRILTIRYSQFLRVKRHFHRSQPQSEDALHEMRIALKKLRYTMEAAQPVLVESEKGRMGAMRAFQKLMGDSRDLEMLRVELEQWAKKKGKKMAVIPALQDLEEKREALLKRLLESSHELENILERKRPAPVAETTQLGGRAAAAAVAIKLVPAPAGTAKNPT
jgi:CHAD domain-containing protein